MPQKPDDPSVELRAAMLLVDDLKNLPKQIKDISGKPPNVKQLPKPDQDLWAWGYVDTSIDVAALRAAGESDAKIAEKAFPLRGHLIKQGGVTYEEQERASDRLAERWMKAQGSGRELKGPERPDVLLEGGKMRQP